MALRTGCDIDGVLLPGMSIHPVRSTHECFDLLLDIDASLERPPGAMERVMRTLGLKQTAGT